MEHRRQCEHHQEELRPPHTLPSGAPPPSLRERLAQLALAGAPSGLGAEELVVLLSDVGIEVDEVKKEFHVAGQTIKEGDWISFDGLSGEVKLAQVASKPSEILQVINGQRTLVPQNIESNIVSDSVCVLRD